MRFWGIVSGLCLLAGTASAGIIHVPTDQPTIQDGIDAVTPGDTVLVADGIYTGVGNVAISNQDKTFVLVSENGPEATVIDAAGSSTFTLSGFGPDGVIEGFTIQNGRRQGNGAMRFVASSPTIRNCFFYNNASIGIKDGGAVAILDDAPRFVSCVFENNSALATSYDDPEGTGGAIFILSAYPIIDSCIFIHNRADYGGAIECALGYGIIKNSVFIKNYSPTSGAAINAQDSILIENCTFYGDGSASVYAVNLFSMAPPDYTIINCLIAYSGGIHINEIDYTDLRNCDFFGNFNGDWTGSLAPLLGVDGNISANPLFCNTASHILTLASNSPCLGAGENGSDIGALGDGCGPLVDADDYETGIRPGFHLFQNHPNPFNPSTRIDFDIPYREHVRIEIYNLLGQKIAALIDDTKPPGHYSVVWNGDDQHGDPVPCGIYLYRLTAGHIVDSKKMILLK